MTHPRVPARDRRVQRTHRALRAALHALIHEKRYDAIAVREILDRADVGRSTFYAHFRGKDELLVTTFRDLLGAAGAAARDDSAGRPDRALSFSRPVLEHVDRHRGVGGRRIGRRGRAVLHAHLRRVLVDAIADGLGRDDPRRSAAGAIPAALLVEFVASTFLLVLDWWVDSGSPLSAAEVDDVFRAMVLPALAGLVPARG